MNIVDYAKSRYTTKAYDPTKKLSNEQIQQIKDILRFTPSSVNSQPWHFILATSDQAKAKIAKAAENIHPKNVTNIKDCALVIVFCLKTDIDDEYLELLLNQERKDGRFPTSEFENMQRDVRRKFALAYKDKPQELQIWTEKQLYIALGNILLGLSALEINATPMEGIEPHIIDTEFNLAEKGLKTSVIVTAGYSSEDDFNAKLPKSRRKKSLLKFSYYIYRKYLNEI
ncbi:NAD(P)H nitroreductase [Francisella tularensis subsp. holarctica]|uniref:oxygen-insensitive NAD(P)H nitroreductase n=1 Tax=Francisella tularensis TaxID=263 RepID=UPI00015D78DD|nr:oxygen-insensitive NAD(P)H nitroreductase [Francisella tularensis]ALK94078.1 dihydropteridine reductase [Francisella tularensis]EDO65637.1 6,7-dihydropteridine reductase [Francisella tularensis subsp. holarctica FSC022]KIP30660.1 nitroreductase family protein [Francisella tularensis subsp. holarctica]MCC9172688.1 oxygen-insensitive NAD(P)H nitroreductase [Francisella tularensis]OCQ61489.1 oxygen-insensitive NAD(P)H-dependent nitroreductase NfsB [Francisella tularensis]